MADSQNWDISLDDSGVVYVANNQGLLVYDGMNWELFPLKSGSILRSVYYHEGRIYTGSYQEFGYWARDNTGEMQYTSLIPLLAEFELQSEEFWEILSLNSSIYFRSFGAVYKYDGTAIEKVLDVNSNKMIPFRDRLLIAKSRDGLYFLNEENELEPLENQEVLTQETVVDLAVSGEELYIATRDDLYLYDGSRVRLVSDSQLRNEIKNSELNHLVISEPDKLLLGTIKNGVIQYNLADQSIENYNRQCGLQNNTVLGMAIHGNHLWLSLDNGIDRVELNSAIKFYTDESGQLGAVYDLEYFENNLYIASNTGIYTLDSRTPVMLEGAEGHTWNLELIDGVLYANHNTGTYRIQNKELIQIEGRTGSFKGLKSPGNSDFKYFGTYTGITAYDVAKNEAKPLSGINFPVKNIIFETENTMWAAHPYEGIYRLELNEKRDEIKSLTKLKGINGEKNYNPHISKINNQLAIQNDDRWYRYNSFKDSIEIFPELERFQGYRMLYDYGDSYWFAGNESNSLVYTDFRSSEIIIPSSQLQNRLVKNNEKMIRANDSVFLVTLNDGFASININKIEKSLDSLALSPPFITAFKDIDSRLEISGKPVLSYKDAREVSFTTAFPSAGLAELRYELIGKDTIKGKVENGKLNFQNLPHGDYELVLSGFAPQNSSIAESRFAFRVNPPWYLSGIMRLAYIFIFLAGLGLLYWFNKQKLRKHQLLLEAKFEKEHKERLNRIEKERLVNEINLKRKELANSTMIAAKKNEVLMEIQGELARDKNKFSNEYRMKHIMTKINKAIKDKDEWKVFETNFNELHADFFKDVLETYPKLSNKDLKLCSYLKMNLSSKEIAPLMGISVRGVEVHRYRLRKKMGLNKKENLTNFLIKNF